MSNFRLLTYSRILLSQKWFSIFFIALCINMVVFFTFIYRYLKWDYSTIQILGELNDSSRLFYFLIPLFLILIAILPEMRTIDILSYKGRNNEILYNGIKFSLIFIIVFIPLFSQYSIYLLISRETFVYFGPTLFFQLEFFLIIWIFYFIFYLLLKNKVMALIITYFIVFLDYFVLFSRFALSLFWGSSAALFWNKQGLDFGAQLSLLGLILLLCGILLVIIYRKDYLS